MNLVADWNVEIWDIVNLGFFRTHVMRSCLMKMVKTRATIVTKFVTKTVCCSVTPSWQKYSDKQKFHLWNKLVWLLNVTVFCCCWCCKYKADIVQRLGLEYLSWSLILSLGFLSSFSYCSILWQILKGSSNSLGVATVID